MAEHQASSGGNFGRGGIDVGMTMIFFIPIAAVVNPPAALYLAVGFAVFHLLELILGQCSKLISSCCGDTSGNQKGLNA